MPRFLRAPSRRILAVAVLIGTLLAVSGQARAVGPVLTFIEAEYNGQHGAEGLDGAQALAVSPDGLHVYVVGTDNDAVAVFSRNPTTGLLSFLQILEEGQNGVSGINGAIDVTVSPDGKHVYTAAVTSSAVAIFSRDDATGLLTFVGTKREADPDVVGLSQASSVTVSPDNAHVYATGRFSDGVVVFSRTVASGQLNFLEAEVGGVGGVPTSVNGPDDVVVSPDGTSVVVASGAGNAVNVFTRSTSTGLLTFLESKIDGTGGVNGLLNAARLAISPDGGNVYATGNGDNAVAVFTRTVASGALNFVEAKINANGGVAGISGALGIAVSPDGENVYVAGLGSDAVAVFGRGGASGALTYLENLSHNGTGGPAFDQPRGVALPPDGGHVYVAASSSDSITSFTRDTGDGTLTYFHHHVNTPRTIGLEQAISVEVSPTGNTVYVNSVAESAVAIYQRNPATGVLTFTQSHAEADGGGFALFGGARAVAVSPDSLNFYVIGASDNSLVAAQRHQTTGASLGVISQLIDGTTGGSGMNSPQDVEVSPDGQHVYVVSSGNDNAVTTFTRSNVNGAVVFTDTIKDTFEGANHLGGAIALAISANGASLYVAASGDHAVTLFSRTPGSGQLTHVETEFDENNGITSLEGANDVAISPDQKNVYVTSADDSAVTVFTRDLGTGALTYLEHDGGQANSMSNPKSVAVSPNGLLVFVTNRDDDKVVVFERDPDTGALTFLEAVADNANGVDGLNEATALQTSPDGLHLYVTGPGDDALAVFSIGEFTGFVEVFLPFVRR